jgi:hypothetical protein
MCKGSIKNFHIKTINCSDNFYNIGNVFLIPDLQAKFSVLGCFKSSISTSLLQGRCVAENLSLLQTVL